MKPGLNTSLLRNEWPNTDLASHPTKTSLINIVETPSLSLKVMGHSYNNHNNNTLILDAAFITTDFDLLRFEAAAQEQLPKVSSLFPATLKDEGRPVLDAAFYSVNLISSPYNSPGHYLDISVLSIPSRLFALALSALKPVRADYATASYTSALNFSKVLDVLRTLILNEGAGYEWRETSFYVVTFRSTLKDNIDNDWLYKLDYESHREACESGGLLKYWFGKSNDQRQNLATCFWHSREDAYKGGLGPWHKKARAAGRELYESIVFSTHRFTVLDGARNFVFEDWNV